MPRKSTVRSNFHFYHLMARSNNREFFYLPILEVWDIFTKELDRLQRKYRLQIPAFVLMSNHFHLMMLTPEEDIDRVMYFLMKHVTIEIQRRTGRINRIFGGRYKGCLIESYEQLVNVYKYVYLNPVKAGIVTRAENYPYSTLYFKYKNPRHCPIQLKEILPKHAFDQYEYLNELEWINLSFTEREHESIKTGVNKTTFSFAKNRSDGKDIKPAVRARPKKTQEEPWSDLLEEDDTGTIKLVEVNEK